MRQTCVAVIALIVCTVGAGAGVVLFEAADFLPVPEARDIQGKDLYGNELTLNEYRGRVVLLAFWTSNCKNLQEFQLDLKNLQTKFGKRGFAVAGVNGDNSRSFAQAVSERNDYDYHSWYDGPHGPISAAWQVKDYPTFFLIDDHGDLAQHYDLFLLDFEIEQDIDRLLRAANK